MLHSRLIFLVLCCAVLLGGFCAPLYAGQSDYDQLLLKLVELKTTRAKQAGDWNEQKEILTYRLKLLAREQQMLLGKLDAQHAKLEAIKDQKHGLEDEKKRLGLLLNRCQTDVDRCVEVALSWQKILPEPFAVKLAPFFDRLSQVAPNKRLARRLKEVLDLFTEIELLHSNIHLVKQIIADPDGQSREFKVLYVGLSAAFALSQDKTLAAAGFPADRQGHWKWFFSSSLRRRIKKAIEIFEHERSAVFIELPIENLITATEPVDKKWADS